MQVDTRKLTKFSTEEWKREWREWDNEKVDVDCAISWFILLSSFLNISGNYRKKLPIVFKWTNKSIRLVIMLWMLKWLWESDIEWPNLRLILENCRKSLRNVFDRIIHVQEFLWNLLLFQIFTQVKNSISFVRSRKLKKDFNQNKRNWKFLIDFLIDSYLHHHHVLLGHNPSFVFLRGENFTLLHAN